MSLAGRGFAGCGKNGFFCHSERSEESLFDLSLRKEREIPRSARNDKMMEGAFSAACLAATFRDLKKRALAPEVRSSLEGRPFMRWLHIKFQMFFPRGIFRQGHRIVLCQLLHLLNNRFVPLGGTAGC
jgi:hypothetical protein